MEAAPEKPPSNLCAKLKCITCEAILSAANPGNIGTDHFDKMGNCKKGMQFEVAGNASKKAKLTSSSAAAGPSSTPSASSPVSAYFCTPSKQAEARKHLAKFTFQEDLPGCN